MRNDARYFEPSLNSEESGTDWDAESHVEPSPPRRASTNRSRAPIVPVPNFERPIDLWLRQVAQEGSGTLEASAPEGMIKAVFYYPNDGRISFEYLGNRKWKILNDDPIASGQALQYGNVLLHRYCDVLSRYEERDQYTPLEIEHIYSDGQVCWYEFDTETNRWVGFQHPIKLGVYYLNSQISFKYLGNSGWEILNDDRAASRKALQDENVLLRRYCGVPIHDEEHDQHTPLELEYVYSDGQICWYKHNTETNRWVSFQKPVKLRIYYPNNGQISFEYLSNKEWRVLNDDRVASSQALQDKNVLLRGYCDPKNFYKPEPDEKDDIPLKVGHVYPGNNLTHWYVYDLSLRIWVLLKNPNINLYYLDSTIIAYSFHPERCKWIRTSGSSDLQPDQFEELRINRYCCTPEILCKKIDSLKPWTVEHVSRSNGNAIKMVEQYRLGAEGWVAIKREKIHAPPQNSHRPSVSLSTDIPPQASHAFFSTMGNSARFGESYFHAPCANSSSINRSSPNAYDSLVAGIDALNFGSIGSSSQGLYRRPTLPLDTHPPMMAAPPSGGHHRRHNNHCEAPVVFMYRGPDGNYHEDRVTPSEFLRRP